MMRFLSCQKNDLRNFLNFLQTIATRWSEDQISCYSAAIAYFSIFALAPLIVICTALIGLIIGNNLAETQILTVASQLMGKESAQQIQMMIVNAKQPYQGIVAEIISFILLFIGASGIFTQIQMGLNVIFPVEFSQPKQKVLNFFKEKFFSFALILGVAFLLLASLILSAILSFFSNYVSSIFSMEMCIGWFLDFFISFLVISLLFGLIYKVLPETKLKWSELLPGSMSAAFLFILGKTILGIYLGTKHVGNAFGPAGSLVIILIWLYYSAQILFLGAEIITINKITTRDTL